MRTLSQFFVQQSDPEIDMWGRIKAERDRRKFGGVNVSEKWIHTDTFSRTQWLAMSMMGAALPEIEWTTMDDSMVITTPELAQQVFQAIAAQDSILFEQAKVHKAAMEASADPANYDFSTGWQPTFEDQL